METRKLIAVDATCGHVCPCGGSSGDGDAMKRRDFVSMAAAALALGALAACGVGGDSPTSPSTLSSTSIALSDFPALANVGGVATTTIGNVPVAIVRTGTSAFSVFSRICPHQGGTINTTSTGFQCPNHGALFNATGAWIGGQRTSNMTSYPVQYNSAAGTLTIGS